MTSFFDEIFEIGSELNQIWKMRPPVLGATANNCWAACMSSWTRATDTLPNMTITQVIERVRERFPSRVSMDGQLIGEPGLDALAKTFGLSWEKTDSSNLNLNYLGFKLKHSYILIVFKIQPEDTLWHTVLLYGIDQNNLCFMDPLVKKRYCQKQWNFALGSPVSYIVWR